MQVEGWTRPSFNVIQLTIGASINLQVQEVLLPCKSIGIEAIEGQQQLAVYPNPITGNELQVIDGSDIQLIEVLDPSGKLIATYAGNVRTIRLPVDAGTYFIRAFHTDGSRSISRLVKQ